MAKNSNGILSKFFGKYICMECKQRFDAHVEFSNGMTFCPYCKSEVWYTFKKYKELEKKGYIVK